MKLLKVTLKIITLLLLLTLVNQYLFCPQYIFLAPKPFEGNKIYNPYADMDSTKWLKCNFHAHTHTWNGFTTGKGTDQQLWSLYDSLQYDVHCISNYEQINRYNDTSKNYLPAYEHGYGFKKNHHLILNADHVIWGDYYFPQSLSNKQRMLGCLQVNDTSLLCINHPLLSYGFPPDNMRYLAGYDCIEVLRGDNTYSFLNWDAALESGKPAFIIADDDLHDIGITNEIARNCTWVNASSVKANNIVHALKGGVAYGMIIGGSATETLEQKQVHPLPLLTYVHVAADTIRLRVNKPAERILFFGARLQQLAAEQHGTDGEYILRPEDPYVRTQIVFADGTQMILNPLFRYDGTFPVQTLPKENLILTILLRMAGGMILIAFIALLFPFRKNSDLPKG